MKYLRQLFKNMPPTKRTNRSGPERNNTKRAKRQHPQVVTDEFNSNNGQPSSTQNAVLSAMQDLIKPGWPLECPILKIIDEPLQENVYKNVDKNNRRTDISMARRKRTKR